MNWLKIRSFTRYGTLLLIVMCFIPMLTGIAASLIAGIFDCRLDEGSPHPCIIMGADWGGTLYQWFVMGWGMLLTFPFALAVLFVWLCSELFLKKKFAETEGI